ncbi:MAG TPA: type II toxin-antitoxin system death-on-curing family toxin [Candidatus Methylomirabilis sp.]|nr:type II toxin-antitoxin system death-on-curing family toxin [Candidatus Methylomirabilis sp.]HSC70786.1 type II toxin-antitoxin system death-on-curing family toxin [Candidatus Methylomirabilis sp.]
MERLIVDAVHLDQLREHGGLPGTRDENALESALARPRNKWAYESTQDLAELAAAYGYGLVSNHPYRDGNKRIAFLTMVIFLGLNGSDLDAPETDVVTMMLAAAEKRCSEAELAAWVRSHVVALP